MFINPLLMQLHITPNSLISDIQKEFNSVFPFLKLEFFNNRSYARADFSARKMITPHRRICEIQLAITDGDIEFSGEMKVAELENHFKEQFNLAVQVFRRSGNLWLETTMTDSWTLQQQNNHGKEITNGKTIVPGPDDYDLNRDADH